MPAPPAKFTWNTAWDEAMFAHGPASIFSVDHKGWLKLDAERTREIWLLTGPLPRDRAAHFVLTDRATGVRTYLLTTHPDLALRQPRGESREFATVEEAWGFVQDQWVERTVSNTESQRSTEGTEEA